MQKLNSMENQKKTYLKPAIRVEEWDFNEAVCANQVAMCSTKDMCINIRIGRQVDHIENRPDFGTNGDISSWRPANR